MALNNFVSIDFMLRRCSATHDNKFLNATHEQQILKGCVDVT